MKNLKIILAATILFLVNFNFAQDSLTKKIGTNGRYSETPWVNGKRNGIQKWYYENGKIWQEFPFIDSKLNGIVKYYHPNGQLQHEFSYKDGKNNGIEKGYSETGTLLFDRMWVNGKTQGMEKYYDKDRKIIRVHSNQQHVYK